MSTFLITDDSKVMRMLLGNILKSAGHTVVGEASNGQEAFELYKRLKPDFVTMDVTMETVDGIQGLKMIEEYDKDAMVIMCSSMGQQQFIIDAFQSGAKDFIIKPFKAEQVLQVIDGLLKSKGKKA